jgi:hypothetical protein
MFMFTNLSSLDYLAVLGTRSEAFTALTESAREVATLVSQL